MSTESTKTSLLRSHLFNFKSFSGKKDSPSSKSDITALSNRGKRERAPTWEAPFMLLPSVLRLEDLGEICLRELRK